MLIGLALLTAGRPGQPMENLKILKINQFLSQILYLHDNFDIALADFLGLSWGFRNFSRPRGFGAYFGPFLTFLTRFTTFEPFFHFFLPFLDRSLEFFSSLLAILLFLGHF
jgi:hypothetical protein